MEGRSVFSSRAMTLPARRRISDWNRRGLVRRLHSAIYAFPGHAYDPRHLAALLSPKSYITGMTALAYHGLLKGNYDPVCGGHDGLIHSAHASDSFDTQVEEHEFRFQMVNRPHYREVQLSADGKFLVAEPLTAIFDLCHRAWYQVELPYTICFESFDTDWLLQELQSCPHQYRPVLGRLLAKCRSVQQPRSILARRGRWPQIGAQRHHATPAEHHQTVPDSVADTYARHVNPAFVKLLGVFGYGRVFTRAQGTRLWDSEEREYLDALASFGATNLGHRHPKLTARLAEELSRFQPDLLHIGPSRQTAELARELAQEFQTPEPAVALFSTSGSEAVESALKLARAATRRPGFVYCRNGFHGTGLGTLSVMGAQRLRAPFEPLLAHCTAVPFGDRDALQKALRPDVAGFLIEPTQGEGGALTAPTGYLAEAQELCRKNGSLLLLDEVQTGLGRTGRMFAFQHHDMTPDVLILGKSLGGGIVPMSAALTRPDVYKKAYGSMDRFDLHGSTYAGYSLGCAAASATLHILKEERLIENASERGEQLLRALRDGLQGHPLVRDVRGQGLLVGIELGQADPRGFLSSLREPLVKAVAQNVFGQWLALRMLERGVICQPAALRWDVLKLEPPLTVSAEEIDQIAGHLLDVLQDYRELTPLLNDVAKRLGKQFLSGWKFPE